MNATASRTSPLVAADARPTTDPSVAVKSCATINFAPFKYTSRKPGIYPAAKVKLV